MDKQEISQDLQIIEDALKAARRLAGSVRRNGPNSLRYKAQSALDALERIKKAVESRQPQLF